MVTASPVLAIGTTLLLIAWTRGYAAAGERAAAAARPRP